MTTHRQSWLPVYSARINRRRFIGGAAAGGAAAALLAACGGDGGGSQLIKGDDARKPGTVWSAKNNWRLEDETKQAVRGGVYRGVETADLPAEHGLDDAAQRLRSRSSTTSTSFS